MRIVVLIALILGLASCGLVRGAGNRLGLGSGSARKAQVEANGIRFRARAIPAKGDKREFSVTVSPVAIDPESSMEAARYQATRYCLLTYGGSDAEWTIGPDLPLDQLQVINDTATLQGRCTQR